MVKVINMTSGHAACCQRFEVYMQMGKWSVTGLAT